METKFETREQWLQSAIAHMRPMFHSNGASLPHNIRVTCGFPGTRAMAGTKNHRIGECWSPQASADGTIEIMISPVVSDAPRVLDILAHELCHAAVGNECGHKGPFKRIAKAIGLVGKMTATTAGPLFIESTQVMFQLLGAYPHAVLDARVGRKKQTTRMHKLICGECGYTVRVAQKWLDDVGAAHCPEHGEMDLDEGGE